MSSSFVCTRFLGKPAVLRVENARFLCYRSESYMVSFMRDFHNEFGAISLDLQKGLLPDGFSVLLKLRVSRFCGALARAGG